MNGSANGVRTTAALHSCKFASNGRQCEKKKFICQQFFSIYVTFLDPRNHHLNEINHILVEKIHRSSDQMNALPYHNYSYSSQFVNLSKYSECMWREKYGRKSNFAVSRFNSTTYATMCFFNRDIDGNSILSLLSCFSEWSLIIDACACILNTIRGHFSCQPQIILISKRERMKWPSARFWHKRFAHAIHLSHGSSILHGILYRQNIWIENNGNNWFSLKIEINPSFCLSKFLILNWLNRLNAVGHLFWS